MEPALHELSVTLAKLGQSFDDMAAEQRAAERRRNRRSIATLVCAIVLVVAACALIYVAVTNRTVLDKINAVTGPSAQQRQAAGVVDILKRNNEEGDCRSRRQQARLPAPNPLMTCAAQTPASVYPGITGEPAKG